MPPGVMLGACPMALLEPVTLQVDRQQDPPALHFRSSTGADVRLRWSVGISAREIDGVAEVVLPDGTIVVREGEQSRVALGGGFTGDDDAFFVCLTYPHPLQPGAT